MHDEDQAVDGAHGKLEGVGPRTPAVAVGSRGRVADAGLIGVEVTITCEAVLRVRMRARCLDKQGWGWSCW